MRKLLLLVALVVLVVFPVAAQGEVVQRIYIVDTVRVGVYLTPAHFGGAARTGNPPDLLLQNANGGTLPYASLFYAIGNAAIVIVDLDTIQQAYVDALPDVIVFPAALDTEP